MNLYKMNVLFTGKNLDGFIKNMVRQADWTTLEMAIAIRCGKVQMWTPVEKSTEDKK